MNSDALKQIIERNYNKLLDEIFDKEYTLLTPYQKDVPVYIDITTKGNSPVLESINIIPVKIFVGNAKNKFQYIHIGNLTYNDIIGSLSKTNNYEKVMEDIEKNYRKTNVCFPRILLSAEEQRKFNIQRGIFKQIPITSEDIIVEVSERQLEKYGSEYISTGYLPKTFKDFSSADTVNTFDDLFNQL